MILLGLFGLFFKLLVLFVVSDLLKTEEVLTRLLVKFTIDKVNDAFDLRDLNEFKGVDSSVGDFQRDIQSDELGLQRSNSDEHLQETNESLTSAVDSLTTT